MGTVKDKCWSTKYRKHLAKPIDEEPKPVTAKITVKSCKNIKTALKIKPKKQESCHSVAKKLVDSLQLLEPAQKGSSRLPVTESSPRPSVEDTSELPDLCQGSRRKERSKTNIYKMCRGKKNASCEQCPIVDCKDPIIEPDIVKCPSEPKGCCVFPKFICCEEPRPKRKKVKGKKVRPSSISVMAASTKTNCCACCCLLAEYFQEILRLFCNKNDTRLSEIFGELCDVAGCICNDCLNFLRKMVAYICAFTKCG